jgi:hypothetical protein
MRMHDAVQRNSGSGMYKITHFGLVKRIPLDAAWLGVTECHRTKRRYDKRAGISAGCLKTVVSTMGDGLGGAGVSWAGDRLGTWVSPDTPRKNGERNDHEDKTIRIKMNKGKTPGLKRKRQSYKASNLKAKRTQWTFQDNQINTWRPLRSPR